MRVITSDIAASDVPDGSSFEEEKLKQNIKVMFSVEKTLKLMADQGSFLPLVPKFPREEADAGPALQVTNASIPLSANGSVREDAPALQCDGSSTGMMTLTGQSAGGLVIRFSPGCNRNRSRNRNRNSRPKSYPARSLRLPRHQIPKMTRIIRKLKPEKTLPNLQRHRLTYTQLVSTIPRQVFKGSPHPTRIVFF